MFIIVGKLEDGAVGGVFQLDSIAAVIEAGAILKGAGNGEAGAVEGLKTAWSRTTRMRSPGASMVPLAKVKSMPAVNLTPVRSRVTESLIFISSINSALPLGAAG